MRRVALAILGSIAMTACAPSLPMAGADPARVSPTTELVPYRSPFKDYVKFELVEPRPWRETNDRVRDLGGPDPQMQADSEDDPMPQPKSP